MRSKEYEKVKQKVTKNVAMLKSEKKQEKYKVTK